MSDETGEQRLAAQRELLEGLTRVGAGLLVALAVLKASVPLVVFPAWDMDPLTMAAPVVGLGPTATLAIDCAMITLSGAILALAAPLVGRVHFLVVLLLLAGFGAAAWHGLFAPGATRANFLVGASWCGAIASAVALAHAARLDSVRRVGAAVALGFLGLLALKGAAQVWVEFPQMVADYNANRAAILAAHGWTPDSFAAKTFERRMNDPSATGWFGLSNVLATFGAAGAGAFLLMALASGSNSARRAGAVLGIGLGLLCVYMAGSKGGWVAAAVSCGMAVVGIRLAGSSARRGAGLMVLVPLAALLAVGVRGLLGGRVGELSLLFRSQYLNAAATIFSKNWASGVGPAGFKDAYLMAKNPLSPEEVASPHSVLFDYAATLGIAGVLWGVLWFTLVGLAGAGLVREEPGAEATRGDRGTARLAMILLAAVVIAGAWIEAAIATNANGIVRIGGLLLGCVLAWCVCGAGGGTLRRALAAGAGALAFHAMIEVTPVQQSSAGLYGCLLGLAAAGVPEGSPVRRGVFVRAVPGLSIAIAGMGASLMIAGVQRWEGFLRGGAERLEPIADIAQQVNDAARREEDQAAVRKAAEELSRILGANVEPNSNGVRRGLLLARRKAGDEAMVDLLLAIAADPTDYETRQAASHLALALGEIDRQLGESPADHLREGLARAEEATKLGHRRAAAWAWLATARGGVYELEKNRRMLWLAAEAARNAATFDPWNPTHAARCARLEIALGNSEAARQWATRALELDENMRLDPLRRFEKADQDLMQGIAHGLRWQPVEPEGPRPPGSGGGK